VRQTDRLTRLSKQKALTLTVCEPIKSQLAQTNPYIMLYTKVDAECDKLTPVRPVVVELS